VGLGIIQKSFSNLYHPTPENSTQTLAEKHYPIIHHNLTQPPWFVANEFFFVSLCHERRRRNIQNIFVTLQKEKTKL
jgi:hypothetical protein